MITAVSHLLADFGEIGCHALVRRVLDLCTLCRDATRLVRNFLAVTPPLERHDFYTEIIYIPVGYVQNTVL